MVPDAPRKPYDVTDVVGGIVDEGSFFETHGEFARTLVTGLARMDGRPVGVVANQPSANAGTLNIEASQKGARFVRFCDSFNIPVLTFVDVPGFMPGTDQEHNGIIRHGAKLIYAYAEATVPLMTVITRKAYGGAYIVMGSKELGADVNYAWPGAEMAVMGHVAAVRILHRRKLAEVEGEDRARVEQELADEHAKLSGGLARGMEIGVIDDVVEPTVTRSIIATALAEAPQRRGQHNNIPL